jgi:hypothetical protein
MNPHAATHSIVNDDIKRLLTPAGVTIALVWLNTEQAAAHMGASRKTLEAWRRIGGGPRYALAGRRRMYRLDWLDEWLESRSVTSNAEARLAGMR